MTAVTHHTPCNWEHLPLIRCGERHGLPWCMHASPLGALNGYVRLPKTVQEDSIPAEVGVTFDRVAGPWALFDTAHAGQWWELDELVDLGVPITTDIRQLQTVMREVWSGIRAPMTADKVQTKIFQIADQLHELVRT
ncbi:hypothetical protein IU485_27600 [Nocardia cyriacigeorgica]|uniref:hypothetical protein n=1 Tax=Nocardia cyriacigeorgica TaxID=135487 RepID=UPI0018937BE5|nr:hypothetical protein [Nocardia cyriacigeorgica]MBF6085142.1 hypothetical protein [Nocardia cyriacigeorgica]